MLRAKYKGFTLIELLVVIAIIGMLSALAVPNFMGARERARDARRKSDLKQIQKALEMYKMDASPQAYPTPTAGASASYLSVTNSTLQNADATIVYMSYVPPDPSDTSHPYYYYVDNTNLTFILYACLENKADSDANVEDCPAGFSTATGYSCLSTTATRTHGTCYKVIQP